MVKSNGGNPESWSFKLELNKQNLFPIGIQPSEPDEDNFNILAEMFIDSPQQQNTSPDDDESFSDPLVTSSSSNGSAGSSDSLDLLHRHPSYRQSATDQHSNYQSSATEQYPKSQQSTNAQISHESFDHRDPNFETSIATADHYSSSHALADQKTKIESTFTLTKQELPKEQASTIEDSFDTPDILTVSHEQIMEERPALHASEDVHDDMASVPVEPLVISEENYHDNAIERSASLDIPVGDDVMLFNEDVDVQQDRSLSRQIRTQEENSGKCFVFTLCFCLLCAFPHRKTLIA